MTDKRKTSEAITRAVLRPGPPLVQQGEIDAGSNDIRVMAAARAAYEAYCRESSIQLGYRPLPWSVMRNRSEALRPWIAAALGALKTYKKGQTGRYRRPGSGSGLIDVRNNE
jgi:hypothetical protein